MAWCVRWWWWWVPEEGNGSSSRQSQPASQPHAARRLAVALSSSPLSVELREEGTPGGGTAAKLSWAIVSFSVRRGAELGFGGREKEKEKEMGGKRVLAVCTSHDKLGATDCPTGLWIEELVAPYYILKEAGVEVDIASTKGGKIPVDPGSLQEGSITEHVKRYLKDDELLKKIEDSLAIKDANETYDGIFLPGGHGIVYDGPENLELIALLEKYWVHGKVVSAICHGPAGLCGVKDPGCEPIVKGRKVTGFTNSEEKAVGKTDVVPFLLEDKLKDLGGIYDCGPDWSPFAVADGNLITGQNPQSSTKVAQLILAALG